ncbi:hypothetical protein D3C80_1414450 [compost metagenome]
MVESYTVMPGVFSMTWSMVYRFWSSIILRVITVTDCGVSFSECSPLPMVTAPVVYEPLFSVVAPSTWPVMLVAPSSIAEPEDGTARST